MTELRVEAVSRSFGRAGIADVSFTCLPGTITAFLGPNGAGKTTTLRVIAGLLRPTSGAVLFGGRRLTELDRPYRAAAFVFGPQSLPQAYTAAGFLRRVAIAQGLDRAAADASLASVGLGGWGAKTIAKLSLGMRQRLAIGAATMARPGCVVMDEPFNGLDPEGIEWLRDQLTALRDGGTTVLVSTHLLREIESSTDHVVVIRDGRVQQDEVTADAGPRSRCVPDDPDRLASALQHEDVVFRRSGEEFVVSLEVTRLLRFCNRHRIDLTAIAPVASNVLEAAYGRGPV